MSIPVKPVSYLPRGESMTVTCAAQVQELVSDGKLPKEALELIEGFKNYPGPVELLGVPGPWKGIEEEVNEMLELMAKRFEQKNPTEFREDLKYALVRARISGFEEGLKLMEGTLRGAREFKQLLVGDLYDG